MAASTRLRKSDAIRLQNKEAVVPYRGDLAQIKEMVAELERQNTAGAGGTISACLSEVKLAAKMRKVAPAEAPYPAATFLTVGQFVNGCKKCRSTYFTSDFLESELRCIDSDVRSDHDLMTKRMCESCLHRCSKWIHGTKEEKTEICLADLAEEAEMEELAERSAWLVAVWEEPDELVDERQWYIEFDTGYTANPARGFP